MPAFIERCVTFWKSRNRLPRNTEVPIAEGLGIFVGVVGWDLLADGHIEIVKAALIAAPATLIWFGARCWLGKERDKDH